MPTDAKDKCPLCSSIGAIIDDEDRRTYGQDYVTCLNPKCKLFGSKLTLDIWKSLPRQVELESVFVIQERGPYGNNSAKLLGAWATRKEAEGFYGYNKSVHAIRRLALENVKVVVPPEKDKKEVASAVWAVYQRQTSGVQDYLVGVWATKKLASQFCTTAGKGFRIARCEVQNNATLSTGTAAPAVEPAGADTAYDLLVRAEFHIEASVQWDQDIGEDFDNEERAIHAREELRNAVLMLIDHMKGQ